MLAAKQVQNGKTKEGRADVSHCCVLTPSIMLIMNKVVEKDLLHK